MTKHTPSAQFMNRTTLKRIVHSSHWQGEARIPKDYEVIKDEICQRLYHLENKHYDLEYKNAVELDALWQPCNIVSFNPDTRIIGKIYSTHNFYYQFDDKGVCWYVSKR